MKQRTDRRGAQVAARPASVLPMFGLLAALTLALAGLQALLH